MLHYQSLKFKSVTNSKAKMIKFSAIINSLILVSVIALCMTITFLQSEGHWSSENVGNEGALMSNLSMDPETKPDFQGMELTVFTRKMIDGFTSAFNWSFSISETVHLGVIVLDYEGVSFIIFCQCPKHLVMYIKASSLFIFCFGTFVPDWSGQKWSV